MNLYAVYKIVYTVLIKTGVCTFDYAFMFNNVNLALYKNARTCTDHLTKYFYCTFQYLFMVNNYVTIEMLTIGSQ